MSSESFRPDFDEMYRDETSVDGFPASTPWDIGAPQPVVQQLVAFGALRVDYLGPTTYGAHFTPEMFANRPETSSSREFEERTRPGVA
jgi:hypothetical protein